MWGRVVEIITAVWLALSPFIFRIQNDESLVLVDTLLALTISILAGLSYWRPTQHAHLAILIFAVGLIVWGRFTVVPPTPIHQNHIVVGLFLLMIAIIPNDASRPPEAWRTEINLPPSESP
jgi:hypothetical protein